MSGISPARVGVLVDYLDKDGKYDENILPTLEMVADDFVSRGVVERPVEFVVRAVQGLPNGSFRAVRDAYLDLVEEDCLVVFGPQVSENGAALGPFIERAQVPTITLAATEAMLGEYSFALPSGLARRGADHHGPGGGTRRRPVRRLRLRGLPHRSRVPAFGAASLRGRGAAHHRRGTDSTGRGRQASHG